MKKRFSRGQRPRQFQSNIPRFDRNTYIRAPQLRVINNDGSNLGVISRDKALDLAREQELDLVLVSPQADPPVARIISWSKFKYEQSKKQKGNKSKSSDLKEMWFKPFIEEGDLQHKVNRIREFIDKGSKVKVTVRSKRGAEFEQVNQTMQRVVAAINEFGRLEGDVKREGRNLAVYVISNK